LKQLFTVNLPEARSRHASAIYHFSGALAMCSDPADALRFGSTARLACQSAAHRRGLHDLPGIGWLSLPLMLERWQHGPIALFSKTQVGVKLDLTASKLVVELTSTEPILVQEAIELALAGLALDWEVQLYLTNIAAPILANRAAPSHAKAFASLPIFGLLAANVSPEAALQLGNNTLMPLEATAPLQYAEALALSHRISL